MLPHKPSGLKEKGKKGKKGPTRCNRNRALATSLPDSIIPVKNLAATYLKMYIALEAAWTKYTSMSHSRLLDRHDIIEKVTCRGVGHAWQYDPFSSVVLVDYCGW